MQEIVLNVAFRDEKDRAERLRDSGLIPAVVYGKEQPTKSIVLNLKDFEKALKIAGESSVVVLKTPSGDINTLIHDLSVDPVKNIPIHADFLAIDMNKEVEVSLPIDFIGESPAAKQGLGVLVKVMHEIKISALPKDLPHNIEVDLSPLDEIGKQIHLKEIKMPKGVKALALEDEVVVAVTAIKEEKEEVSVDLSTIEISEERGKKETEEETPKAE